MRLRDLGMEVAEVIEGIGELSRCPKKNYRRTNWCSSMQMVGL